MTATIFSPVLLTSINRSRSSVAVGVLNFNGSSYLLWRRSRLRDCSRGSIDGSRDIEQRVIKRPLEPAAGHPLTFRLFCTQFARLGYLAVFEARSKTGESGSLKITPTRPVVTDDDLVPRKYKPATDLPFCLPAARSFVYSLKFFQ